MNAVLRYLDLLVPDASRKSPTDLMRAYILVGVLCANVLTTTGVFVALCTVFRLPSGNQSLAILVDLVCLAAYVLALRYFRSTGNFRVSSHAVICTLAAVNFLSIGITGGYMHSPVTQLLLLLPVTAFLLLGLRDGARWLLASVLLAMLSFTLDRFDILNAQLIVHERDRLIMAVSLQVILLGMVGAALIVYEIINESLKEKLQDERNRFEHKASHDELTGLPNRFEFFRRMHAGMIECDNREQKMGVIYIDLDGFKPVNDQLGHHAGDLLLKSVARNLTMSLRVSDTCARLGGDEFSVILPGINAPEDVERIANKLLATIARPLEIEGSKVQVCGSLGVAVYPDHSRDIDELCHYADVAMYKAKLQHNAYVYFDRSLLESGYHGQRH